MPISGRISVDVEFTDSSESGVTKNTRRLTLKGAEAFTTGKVAIVTATCGSAFAQASSFAIANPGYVNASGETVSFSSVTRVAIAATSSAFIETSEPRPFTIASCAKDDVGVGVPETPNWPTLRVQSLSGTCSYTVILYGT